MTRPLFYRRFGNRFRVGTGAAFGGSAGNASIISGTAGGYVADDTKPLPAAGHITLQPGGGYAIDTLASSGVPMNVVGGVVELTV